MITAGHGKPMFFEGIGVMVMPPPGEAPPAQPAAGEAPATGDEAAPE